MQVIKPVLSSKDRSREVQADSKKNAIGFIDLNTARHEVRQFGIKGFEGTKKDDAVLDMLTKLGAKAPKKTCTNYKEYQIQKRKEKEISSASKWQQNKSNLKDADRKRKSKKVVKSDGSAKKKTSRNSIGIQRISSKDLKMMKNTGKSQ